MTVSLVFIPIVSAAIGWGTNVLAIRMLFRPYKAWRFGPFVIQGLVPRRHAQLADKIADTVESHLFQKNDLASVDKIAELFEGENGASLRSFLDDKIEDFIQNRLFSFNPMLAGFVNDDIRVAIKKVVVDEIFDMLPSLAEQVQSRMADSIDIKETVRTRINAFDLHQLENIIMGIASRELKGIEVWGGVLGFLIGCGQVLLITMTMT